MSTRERTPESARETAVLSPAVDIEEGESELILWADVPGVTEDDLRITLDRNVLTIAARASPDVRPSYQVAHREYVVGDYRRVFTLSDSIDQERISATLKDGVLRLTLPKTVPAQPRQIRVNSR